MPFNNPEKPNRRKLLTFIGVSAVAVQAIPSTWTKPLINSVLLPAHAQTSVCVADDFIGGPLLGNPSGALNCQDACEAEAAAVGAQLCSVEETVVAGATQCGCNIDTTP